MPLIQFIILLAVAGFIMWVINYYIPMQPMIKKILNVVVVIVIIFWILNLFGLLGSMNAIHIGR
jgi:hypothetical protein